MIALQDIEVYNRVLLDAATNSAVNGIQSEMCGYFIKAKNEEIIFKLYPNSHPDPQHTFKMTELDYLDASSYGEIVGLFHSHINSNTEFSDIDKGSCERLGIPWILYVIPEESIHIMYPSGWVAPYTGREFIYGLFDCYALTKDIYRKDLGIILNDYPRGEVGEWNDVPGWDFFNDNFAKEGFVEVPSRTPFKKYDILLFRIGSRKFNHCAVCWEPNRNTMMHHLLDRASVLGVFGGSTFRIGKRLRYSQPLAPINN